VVNLKYVDYKQKERAFYLHQTIRQVKDNECFEIPLSDKILKGQGLTRLGLADMVNAYQAQ
jgi:hypothetical protein